MLKRSHLALHWLTSVRKANSALALTLGAAAIGSLWGCNFYENRLNNPDKEITIRLPWQQADGHIQMQNIQVQGLNSLAKMDGSFAKFYVHPTNRGNSVDGRDPSLSFVKMQGGYYLPKNTFSLELASVYAHLEQLGHVDASLVTDSGLSLYDLNSWPMKVGVRTLFPNPADDNPAFYSSTFDTMFFQSYTRSELPLQVNGGVIAHEHFHSLFQRVVLDPLAAQQSAETPTGLALPPTKFSDFIFESELFKSLRFKKQNTSAPIAEENDPNVAQPYLERGFNEGLADVWGWLYTKDPDFVGRSISGVLGVRSLTLNRAALFSMQSFVHHVETLIKVSEAEPFRLSYELGTQNAGFIRAFLMAGLMNSEATENLNLEKVLESVDYHLTAEKQLAVRESIVKAMEVLRDQYLAVGKSADTTSLVRAFVKLTPKMNQLQCFVARDFLHEAVSGEISCVSEAEAGVFSINEKSSAAASGEGT